MSANFVQNWPVYLLGGAFIVFVFYAVNNSRQEEKKEKAAKEKEKAAKEKERKLAELKDI